MKAVVKPELKSKTFCINKSYILLRDKELGRVSIKFYQRLFILLISLSTFLIIPESPRELENICQFYNSKKLCDIW